MRKIILPVFFFIVAFTTATNSNAQPNSGDGAACGTAPNIPLDGLCRNYVQAANPIMTGNPVYGCSGMANGGRYYWVKFRTTLANQCASLEINATNTATGLNVPVEVAFYRRANPAVDPCPGGLQNSSNGSMCFSDGAGIWAPLAPNFNLQANSDYFIRLYSPIATPANLRYNICGRQFVPENDFCADATPLPAAPNPGVLDNNVCATASTQEGQAVTPSWICAISYQNMAWYSFTTQGNPGASTINISGVDCDTYQGAQQNFIQAGLLILKPGRNCFDPGSGSGSPFQMAGGTDASPAAVCANPGTGGSVALTTRSLPYGTRVYLAIDGYDGANCKYVLDGINIVPIPITLKHLIASRDGDMNRISWVTSSEFNNDYFEVERSADGVKFESIGRVQGSKNSSADVYYSINDNNPPAIAYYRLKQVDVDGSFTFSKVVMVKRENVSGLSISFSNPVRNGEWLTINTLEAGKLNLQVVDGTGRSLSVQSINCQRGNNTVMKDFSKLSAGNYYLVLTQDDKRIVKPFIKQ